MERLLSALLPFSRLGPEGQLAAKALGKGSPALPPPGPPPAQMLLSSLPHALPPETNAPPSPVAPSLSSFCSLCPFLDLQFSLSLDPSPSSVHSHPSPTLDPTSPLHPLVHPPDPFAGLANPASPGTHPPLPSHPQAPGLFRSPHLSPSESPIPAWAPLLTLSPCPWPVLSLKQLLFPMEEDSGAGPPRAGDGVPGGGPLSPAQTQEIREELLSLEETIKQLEVVPWAG